MVQVLHQKHQRKKQHLLNKIMVVIVEKKGGICPLFYSCSVVTNITIAKYPLFIETPTMMFL
jgi:hypothetical protein